MNEPNKIIDTKNDVYERDNRKEYHKPAIIHEQNLEARAGSPVPGSIDILEMNSTE
jgi:hypothetical protein